MKVGVVRFGPACISYEALIDDHLPHLHWRCLLQRDLVHECSAEESGKLLSKYSRLSLKMHRVSDASKAVKIFMARRLISPNSKVVRSHLSIDPKESPVERRVQLNGSQSLE